MAAVKLGSKPVGSIVKMNFEGVPRNFIIVHQGRPSTDYHESCNGTWLLMEKCCGTCQWHSSDVNNYAESTAHKYLNSTILSKFDADIKSRIKQVKIPYSTGQVSAGTVFNGGEGLSAKIFFLSFKEVGREKYNGAITREGAKLDYFGNITLEASLDGKDVSWWSRSSTINNIKWAWYFGSFLSYTSCTSVHAIRPTLIFPSTAMVAEDGTILTNTAPAAPASINLPINVQGGTTISISWGAGTDAEDNLEGYIVERSVDGGSNWVQIYQGGATSTTNTVPFGNVK